MQSDFDSAARFVITIFKEGSSWGPEDMQESFCVEKYADLRKVKRYLVGPNWVLDGLIYRDDDLERLQSALAGEVLTGDEFCERDFS